jgi:hypothetical protein
MGMVAATVKVPHGDSAKALTTIKANTARRISMMKKVPNKAIMPGVRPISSLIRSPSERPSRRVEMNSTVKSCTAPPKTTPASSHSMPGM